MISHLNGKLISKSSTEAIIECGGVGYGVIISVNTSILLPEVGENTKIYTFMVTKDESTNLFGFATESEREAFKLLITISGIGPKTAIAILSSLTVEDLQSLILTGNTIQLSKLPNIGKKTAERLVLELRDKIDKLSISKIGIDTAVNQIKLEAISALITLGFNKSIAESAVNKALKELQDNNYTAEDLIKKSLKYAMR